MFTNKHFFNTDKNCDTGYGADLQRKKSSLKLLTMLTNVYSETWFSIEFTGIYFLFGRLWDNKTISAQKLMHWVKGEKKKQFVRQTLHNQTQEGRKKVYTGLP